MSRARTIISRRICYSRRLKSGEDHWFRQFFRALAPLKPRNHEIRAKIALEKFHLPALSNIEIFSL